MEAVKVLIEKLHRSPTKFVIIAAGGGSQAFGWLLSSSGASNTILEVTIPYSKLAMNEILGKSYPQVVSRQSAQGIAQAAYRKALKLSLPGTPVIGVGFTGALASTSQKKGGHRCFLTAKSQSTLWEWSLEMKKGSRDRFAEDDLTSKLLVNALGQVSGLEANIPMDFLEGENVEAGVSYASEMQQVEHLLSGEVPYVVFGAPQGKSTSGRLVILPGSFNPLHEGHIGLLEAACRNVPEALPCFEMSVVNADKPPLAVEEILSRVAQFKQRGFMIVVTSSPLFHQKAELFPGSTFVIGYDTAVRIINENYYKNYNQMIQEIQEMGTKGCSFTVAGRFVNDGFHDFSEVDIPLELKKIFKGIPEKEFRKDVSSTEIRARNQK